MRLRVNFKKTFTLSFIWIGCLPKAIEPNYPAHSWEAEEMDLGFSQRHEMKIDLSWIWTRVTDSISYDENCYAASIA